MRGSKPGLDPRNAAHLYASHVLFSDIDSPPSLKFIGVVDLSSPTQDTMVCLHAIIFSSDPDVMRPQKKIMAVLTFCSDSSRPILRAVARAAFCPHLESPPIHRSLFQASIPVTNIIDCTRAPTVFNPHTLSLDDSRCFYTICLHPESIGSPIHADRLSKSRRLPFVDLST